MKATFHGAARMVTGSQHLLEVGGRKILLDCGLFQGHRQESERLNREHPYDPSDVDVIILSHAHIDHSGNLPTAVRHGFDGIILSTFATRDLAAIMLPDSAHIQHDDTEYLNRKRARKDLPPLEPLYGMDEVMATLDCFVSIPYGKSYRVFDNVTLRFLDAGHILGSSQVELTVREDGRKKVLLFSGDLGRPGRPILRDPDFGSRPDLLIMESTYGNRLHGPVEEAEEKFARVLNDTHQRGGKVIIPSFSVGRTQEVLYYLHELDLAGRIPKMPVYVDSPLSFNATEVYQLHPECFDRRMREIVQSRQTPFQSDNVHFTQSVAESKALNADRTPMVIISASGMCEVGRILHHLKNNIGDEANTVLIVGFMAEHTLGRRLVEGEETVRIFGEEYARRAPVEVIDGFSAHADAEGLMRYAATVGEKAGKVVLVHGEEEGIEALGSRIRSELGREVIIPHLGDTVDL
ncbi:MAG: MBL fold metallo-hydrolase [Candidatus Fermentibacteraceae bacterium]